MSINEKLTQIREYAKELFKDDPNFEIILGAVDSSGDFKITVFCECDACMVNYLIASAIQNGKMTHTCEFGKQIQNILSSELELPNVEDPKMKN